jgi:hypothetical protein
MIQFGLVLTYVLIGLCVLAIVGFAIMKAITHFSKVKTALLGLAAIAIIFIIGYAASSGADFVDYPAAMGITESKSRLVSMGLTSFIVLSVIAVGSIIFAEVSRIFK